MVAVCLSVWTGDCFGIPCCRLRNALLLLNPGDKLDLVEYLKSLPEAEQR